MSMEPTFSEFDDFNDKYYQAINPPNQYKNYLLYLENKNQITMDRLAMLRDHPVYVWLNAFPSYKNACEGFIECMCEYDGSHDPGISKSSISVKEWKTITSFRFAHEISSIFWLYFAIKNTGGVYLPDKRKRGSSAESVGGWTGRKAVNL